MSSSNGHKLQSQGSLSKIAANRLQKELSDWQTNPPPGFKHKVSDNLQRWIIELTGAPGTMYANETYQLQVDFSHHYPIEAPQVIFLQPVPLHPHIYSNGHICLGLLKPISSVVHRSSPFHALNKKLTIQIFLLHLCVLHVTLSKVFHCLILDSVILSVFTDILYDSWSPAMTVSSVCVSILSMLSSANKKQRPPDNDRYLKNCRNGRSPKETRWWFHDDKA